MAAVPAPTRPLVFPWFSSCWPHCLASQLQALSRFATSALKQQLDTEQRQHDQTRQQLLAEQQQHEATKQELQTAQQQLDNLQQQYDQLLHAHDELQKQYSSLQADVQALQEQREAQQAEASKQQHELLQLRAVRGELDAAKNTLTAVFGSNVSLGVKRVLTALKESKGKSDSISSLRRQLSLLKYSMLHSTRIILHATKQASFYVPGTTAQQQHLEQQQKVCLAMRGRNCSCTVCHM